VADLRWCAATPVIKRVLAFRGCEAYLVSGENLSLIGVESFAPFFQSFGKVLSWYSHRSLGVLLVELNGAESKPSVVSPTVSVMSPTGCLVSLNLQKISQSLSGAVVYGSRFTFIKEKLQLGDSQLTYRRILDTLLVIDAEENGISDVQQTHFECLVAESVLTLPDPQDRHPFRRSIPSFVVLRSWLLSH